MKERNVITVNSPGQAKIPSAGTADMPLRFVKGVGPKRLLELEHLGIHSARDLLSHFPRRYEDRTALPRPMDAREGDKVLIEGTVRRAKMIRTRHGPTIFRLEVEAGFGPVAGLWFRSEYLEETFKGVARVALFGKLVRRSDEVQLIHPDYEILPAGSESKRVHTGRIVPFYSCGGDLTPRVLRSIQYQLLLDALPQVDDPLPVQTRQKREIENRRFALKSIHFPGSEEDLRKAYRRLVFDEFFFIQLLLVSRKQQRRIKAPAKSAWTAAMIPDFEKLLPFVLTDAQRSAIREIMRDLGSGSGMHRLLQGEVGCGKTIVAAFALYAAARAGRQGVILAPTEILAQQHFLTLGRIFAEAGIVVSLLSRGVGHRDRERVRVDTAAGKVAIVVGTHALFSEQMIFKDLAVVVADEQHKFGVFQRKTLEEKSKAPHVLAMTATPIPQTLAMTLYGDMDVTVMKGRPAGRGKVHTLWAGSDQRDAIMAAMSQLIADGRQAFVVFSSVDTNMAGSKSAEDGARELQKRLEPHRVGLIHGRMSADQKRQIMEDFLKNQIRVLAATTVVEVGIDVPNAAVLVVENAERFGLSQLHQLRGRIGRGKHESYCFLISDAVDEVARQRLEAFVETESGFEIAEKDMRLRGPGDIWGARQHGIPQLKIGNFAADEHILIGAREEAEEWIAADPILSKPEHQAAREELRVRFPEFKL